MLDLILKIDYWLFTQINSEYTCSLADSFFVWITDLHKTFAFKIIVIPLLFFVFFKKYNRKGITFFFFLVLALSVNDFVGAKVKSLIERERPQFNTALNPQVRSDAGHFSFYSNHAANMFTFATYTSIFFPAVTIPVFIIASLVAYSRVYNGVHYPTDVLSGILVGLLWGFIFSIIVKKLTAWLETRKANS